VQTAFSIQNVSSSVNFFPGGDVGGAGGQTANSTLSVSFDIFNQGPNHIAGILVTTDFWFTWQIVHAQFVQFIAGDGESWSLPPGGFEVAGGSPATFQFVVFCDDLGGVESVPRIWNTNGGSVFTATV
jgi:hypothetical protein